MVTIEEAKENMDAGKEQVDEQVLTYIKLLEEAIKRKDVNETKLWLTCTNCMLEMKFAMEDHLATLEI